MTISSTRQGGRRIELFLPFTVGRKRVKAITLRPLRWDQSLKWQEGGHYQSTMHLLFDVADQPEEIMREIRYPDVERIMMMFIDLLPNEIRESVVQGIAPRPNVGLSPEQIEQLLANRQEPEPEYVQEPEHDEFVPEEPVPEELVPEQGLPSPEDYDKTIKAALEKGEKPWPEYPWAPGTPGPEIKTDDNKPVPAEAKVEKPDGNKPTPAETNVGFDLL